MEFEQDLIRQSVKIDKKLNRAVATLPFITNPKGKLCGNQNVADKRLENVVRKYSSNPEIKEKLKISQNKLIDRGHVVLLRDLSEEKEKKLKRQVLVTQYLQTSPLRKGVLAHLRDGSLMQEVKQDLDILLMTSSLKDTCT